MPKQIQMDAARERQQSLRVSTKSRISKETTKLLRVELAEKRISDRQVSGRCLSIRREREFKKFMVFSYEPEVSFSPISVTQ